MRLLLPCALLLCALSLASAAPCGVRTDPGSPAGASPPARLPAAAAGNAVAYSFLGAVRLANASTGVAGGSFVPAAAGAAPS